MNGLHQKNLVWIRKHGQDILNNSTLLDSAVLLAEAVINFANKFITVSLNSYAVSEPVVDIGNMVNIHHYTKLVINATLVVGSLSLNIQFDTSPYHAQSQVVKCYRIP